MLLDVDKYKHKEVVKDCANKQALLVQTEMEKASKKGIDNRKVLIPGGRGSRPSLDPRRRQDGLQIRSRKQDLLVYYVILTEMKIKPNNRGLGLSGGPRTRIWAEKEIPS